MEQERVSFRVSVEAMRASRDSFQMIQDLLNNRGFDLSRTYSMYFDEATDCYVYHQKKGVKVNG